MPSKKKKYNARFPAGRIKKIMQTDEEVGKVAQAVPVIISRTLELFVGSLLNKAMLITSAKNAKTLSPSHMKQCILSEQRFDFLKDLVKTVQDSTNGEDETIPTTAVLATGRAYSGPDKHISERRKSCNSTNKQETVVNEDIEIKEELEVKGEPQEPLSERSQIVANCSSLHLSPHYYSEVAPEQKFSIHQPPIVPGLQPTPPHYQEPSRITPSPVLVMDEDYDT